MYDCICAVGLKCHHDTCLAVLDRFCPCSLGCLTWTPMCNWVGSDFAVMLASIFLSSRRMSHNGQTVFQRNYGQQFNREGVVIRRRSARHIYTGIIVSCSLAKSSFVSCFGMGVPNKCSDCGLSVQIQIIHTLLPGPGKSHLLGVKALLEICDICVENILTLALQHVSLTQGMCMPTVKIELSESNAI